MAYCCVPGCRSDSRSKLPGLSFHEIPADEALRQQWIKAIRRDDWEPNTNSNYSRVCSRHFTETEFTEGKRRRLKKGVVPSVFPEYPAYLRPQPLKERSSENIRKRSAPQRSDNENAPPQKRRKRRDGDDHQEKTLYMDQPSCAEEPIQDSSSSSTLGAGQAAVEISTITNDPQHCPRTDVVDKATQVSVGLSSLLATERAKWKRKERDLKKQIERLKKQIERNI